MKSKGITLALLLTMIISIMPVTAFATEFTDMPNNWSTVALEKAASNGLLKGNDGKIMPNDNLTRAQMAAVVNRAFGTKEKAVISNFKDVSSNSWYYDDMSKAVQMKTFLGSGNKLNPDNNITREEAFVVLARAIKLEGASESVLKKFTDYELVSRWARDGVASLVSAGYVSGSNSKLNPKDNITRAEFAKIMDNLIKSYINDEGTVTTVAEGNIMVQVPNVTLKDLTVKGDLIIGDGVGDGDVTLDNITVTGRLVIRGGGENSIRIIGNSNIQNIVIARIGGVVRVFAENGIEIGEVIVDGSDDVTIEGYMRVVIVTAADVTVNAINSDIDSATIEGENSRIIVASSSNIGTVNLDAPNTKVEVLGKVTQINTTEKAEDAFINVSSKGIVEDIVAEGEGTTIEGRGIVKTVAANADGIEVNTVNTKVTAGKGTVGVTGIDENVKAGNTIITGEVKRESSGGSSGGSDEINVNAINVTGVAKVGQTLTATFANSQNPTVTYKWQYSTDGITYIDIDGAISSTYTITEGYVGMVIKVSATGTGIYTGTVQSAATSSIEKANTIVTTWPTVSDITYGELLMDSMITTGTSSVPGTFTFDETGIILTAGNHNADVTFIPTDAVNYSSVSGTVMVSVNPKMLTATATVNDKVYDGNTNATGSVSLSGIVGTDTVTASGTFTFASKNVGTNKAVDVTNITLSGEDALNYTVNATTSIANITPITLVATARATGKTYDGTLDATGTVALEGILSYEVVTASGNFTFEDKNVGTDKKVNVTGITLGGTASVNYTVNATTTTIANITPITLKATATAANKTYDGSLNTTGTVALEGVLSGEDVIANGTFEFADKNVGTDKIVNVTNITLGGAAAGNYTVNATTTATANIIAKVVTATPSADNKTYDGSTDATGKYTISDIESSDIVTIAATFKFDDKNVGTGKIVRVMSYTVNGADSGNYTVNATTTTTANITPITLIATASATSKTYDTTLNATGEVTLEGILSGEVVTASGIFTFEDKNVGTDKKVNVTGITLGGTASANYTVNATTTTIANITPLTLIATATAADKIYDGILNATGTVTLSGILSDEVVTASGIFTFEDENVGTSKTVNVTGITLSGTAAGNYTVNTTTSASANITARTIIIYADVKDKDYGDVDPTFTYTLSEALMTGDSFTGILSRAAGSNVGDYAINQGTLTAGANYAISFESRNLTINKKDLTVTATDKEKSYGETDPIFTVTYSEFAYDDDATDLAGTIIYNRELGEIIGEYVITPSGKTSNNYNIAYVNGKLTINKLPITIWALSATKTYDGLALSNLGSELEAGTILPFGDSLYSVTTTGYQKNVGASANRPSGGIIKKGQTDVTSNYDINYIDGTLKVNSREITVTANSSILTYNGIQQSVSGWSYTSGTIASNQTLTADAGASGTDAEVYISTFTSVTIKDANNNDVTENYAITKINGSLTINPIQIIIVSQSATKTYDGTPLVKLTSELNTSTPLAVGDELYSVNTAGTQTNAGYSDNTPSNAIIMRGDDNVTDNYSITYTPGTLRVDPATPVLTVSPSATSITSGQSLSSSILSGGEVKFSGYVLDGEFAFTNQNTVPTTTGSYSVTFTPTSSNFTTISTDVNVTVVSSSYFNYRIIDGTTAAISGVKSGGVGSVEEGYFEGTLTIPEIVKINNVTYDVVRMDGIGFSVSANKLYIPDNIYLVDHAFCGSRFQKIVVGSNVIMETTYWTAIEQHKEFIAEYNKYGAGTYNLTGTNTWTKE